MTYRTAYGVRAGIVHLGLAVALVGAAPPTAPVAADDVHILAFGDSLTAGFGLNPGLGFAPQLEDTLRRNGVRAQVTDGGVSGDTTAAGRARLAWTLDGMGRKPDLVIVALGGNDMLRGLPVQQTRADMNAIVAELDRRDIDVLIAGMVAAPNLGPDYGGAFNAIFPALARQYDTELYPFFLANVAGDRRLNLADGIHPNFQGIKRMVTGIMPSVTEAL